MRLLDTTLAMAFSIALSVAAAFSFPRNGRANPVPSDMGCDNRGSAWTWSYPDGSTVPDASLVIDGGNCDAGADGKCRLVPANACVRVDEVVSSAYGDNKPLVPLVKDPGFVPETQPPDMLPAPPPLQPTPPVAHNAPPPPAADCMPGQGWDFETFDVNAGYASFQHWTGTGTPGLSPFVDIRNADRWIVAAPVYGNAVPIYRIEPPGYSDTIGDDIGGDYWRFSQDINQSGSFWVSSLERRYSWKQQPGEGRDTWTEGAIGTLTSPQCVLRARYLTFKIGGSFSRAQRVELEVQGADPGLYFGLRFDQGQPGDPNALGALGHPTQYTSVPTLPATIVPGASGEGWVLERASTSDYTENDYLQIHVWDLQPFIGQSIRIRVVDDQRGDCTFSFWGDCLAYAPEHINVDDFRFSDDVSALQPTWLPHTDGQCGGVPGAGDGCSPDGWAKQPLPLWGVTDAHAHPMANTAFGGHFMWGDVSDALNSVYDCNQPLPAIAGPGGRPAITMPARASLCTLSASMSAFLIGAANLVCEGLVALPFVGGGAAALCKVTVDAAVAGLQTTTILEGWRLHGGLKLSNGAIKFGLLKSMLPDIPSLKLAFAGGVIPEADSTVNGPPGSDWPEDEGWHSNTGLNKTHNMYQADMIRRAYAGGMRLSVWDVSHSRALALVSDNSVISDWRALKDGTDAAKRIVSTTLADIAEIAYSPDDADRIVRAGKLAVILGSEVDELGVLRPRGLAWPESPASGDDSVQTQVADLWQLGIRKVTPVHAANNPIGGAAIFISKYDSNNYFVNSTPANVDPPWVGTTVVNIVLPSLFGPFGGMPLLQDHLFNIYQPVTHKWNPTDWFDFDLDNNPNDAILFDPADALYPVTYRIGADGFKGSSLRNGSGWLSPGDVFDTQLIKVMQINDLPIFASPLPDSNCSLGGVTYPLHPNSLGDVVDKHYTAVDGHRNALGLFHADDGSRNDGEAFLRAAMETGMLIDMDHLSQKMRSELYQLGNQFASEAGLSPGPCADGLPCRDYPFVSVHSKVRGLEIDGNNIEEYRDAYGWVDEASRTPREIRRVAANNGAIAVFPTGSAFIPPNSPGSQCSKDSDCANYAGVTGNAVCVAKNPGDPKICLPQDTTLQPRNWELPPEVANNCDFSSKTFATKYLYLMKLMNGHGLTPATDINGLITTLKPRFGLENPGAKACGDGNSRAVTHFEAQRCGGGVCWRNFMLGEQHWEYDGVWYDAYDGWPTVPEPYRPYNWPANLRSVVARGANEQREDLAPRFPRQSAVYYNNYGPRALPLTGINDPSFQSGNAIGAQMYPIKRWSQKNAKGDGWDFNLDGLQHIGLYPDLFQDMRNIGVQWEQMGPLFHSVRDYIGTWRRATAIGQCHLRRNQCTAKDIGATP
jgi:microsomal dipeptidase-like Zn-dependent dipeptidase